VAGLVHPVGGACDRFGQHDVAQQPLVRRIVVVGPEEHRAAVAHDAVHPGLVADEPDPVVAEALSDAERRNVVDRDQRRPQA
jgi:hypothetical protein